uniref:Uncharacterized protein n=1 Tax=Arundo donax TaxID=35708 RepID=A0A0A9C192_ARUDO
MMQCFKKSSKEKHYVAHIKLSKPAKNLFRFKKYKCSTHKHYPLE